MSHDGLLVLDKPTGITSRAAVDRAQRWFPPRTRIGHAGTLDPLATGVLVLCVGSATRLIEYVQRMAKTYRAGIFLGAASDTDDADGTITPTADATPPTREAVAQGLARFVGTFEQVPPAFSAAKVTGRRAYALARKGKDVHLAPRPVTIHAIDVIAYAYPLLDVIVRCGKGTYIRALARDLGRQLGCGGYIASLRRTAIGDFTPADATPLDAAAPVVLDVARAVSELRRIVVDAATQVRLLHGQHVPTSLAGENAEVAVFDSSGRLLAIADLADGTLHAKKVFPVVVVGSG